MKLIDFKQDQELNELRHDMGCDDFGRFELFDPNKHLTWQERKALIKGWVNINSTVLYAKPDKTLAYKNSHIMTIVNDEVHFAYCDEVKKRISQGKLSQVDVSLNTELFKGKKVCQYCLHAIGYQGFDAYRHRHQEYNDKIARSFKLESYLSEKYGS